MAAIRCAGALLCRRAPGILRREQGLLLHRMAPISLSSKRYISCDYFEEHYNKKLAAELMKERSSGNEIENLEEMLRLMNSHADNMSSSHVRNADAAMSDPCRQLAAARKAIEEKRLDLISHLLRPGDGGQETVKKKMEGLALAVRDHRHSLLLECIADLKATNELHAKILGGIMLFGVPFTVAVLTKLQ